MENKRDVCVLLMIPILKGRVVGQLWSISGNCWDFFRDFHGEIPRELDRPATDMRIMI